LAQNFISVHAYGGGYDQGVNVIDAQVSLAGDKDDALLGTGQFTGAVGDQLQRPDV
jgi:hypothetical protein